MGNTHTRPTPVDWERLLDRPRVYVDLNGGGRVGDTYIAPLDSRATAADLRQYGVTPQEGLRLHFWTDDGDEEGNPDPLLFTGSLHFSEEEGVWLAHMDWADFQHASEVREADRRQKEPA